MLPTPLALCVSAKAAAELDLAAAIDPRLAVTTATAAAEIFRLPTLQEERVRLLAPRV